MKIHWISFKMMRIDFAFKLFTVKLHYFKVSVIHSEVEWIPSWCSVVVIKKLDSFIESFNKNNLVRTLFKNWLDQFQFSAFRKFEKIIKFNISCSNNPLILVDFRLKLILNIHHVFVLQLSFFVSLLQYLSYSLDFDSLEVQELCFLQSLKKYVGN